MDREVDLFAVGSFGPPDRWNPSCAIQRQDAWPLLRHLHPGPATADQLAQTCGRPRKYVEAVLTELAELDVVRPVGDRWALGFAWFSGADQEAIHAAALPVAGEIAAAIDERRAEIDAAIGRLTATRWCAPRDLRFALVGCFGLDWGGLERLKASGHLVHGKPQPGDRQYVMYVQERVAEYNQKDYTGSHSQSVGEGYTWSSFGDHSGRRFGLPDMAWYAQAAVSNTEMLPAEVRPVLGGLVLDGLARQMASAAAALVRLVRSGTEPQGADRSLLEAAGAVSPEGPSIPVFFRRKDGEAIDRIVQVVTESLLAVVRERYGTLQIELADLPALRHGVPFAECFNMIWHVIFGHTNRLLAEQGYLSDPVPSRPEEGRYRWWLTAET